jgi:propionyl-CoA carboxylase alpha chain
MIRVAYGEKLGLAQTNIIPNGWAIESRLYAEDPYRNFLPSIGQLTRYRPPQEGQRPDGSVLRYDTGVFEGGEISMYYDPMIAKLCTWAPTRNQAITAMAEVLDEFEVEGISHNLPFLSAVMGHKRFQAGEITTGFIAEEFPDGFTAVMPEAADRAVLAQIAAFVYLTRERRAGEITGAMENHQRHLGADWVAQVAGQSIALKVEHHATGLRIVLGGDAPLPIESDWTPGMFLGHFTLNGVTHAVKVNVTAKGIRLRRRGQDEVIQVWRPRIAELAKLMPLKKPKDTSRFLLCPMPGLLRSLAVGGGQPVEAGQTLAVVEAMKMENVLRAERTGVVKRVIASVGQSLAVDELIMEFE